jgi:hypothetical protein
LTFGRGESWSTGKPGKRIWGKSFKIKALCSI